MSKLLKLKEWLTVADAARHLSILLEAEVNEADVYRLALEGTPNALCAFCEPHPLHSVGDDCYPPTPPNVPHLYDYERVSLM